MTRPELNKTLDADTFRSFYYLKEELISFCKQEGIQRTGSKSDLTERIAHYLTTGQKLTKKYTSRKNTIELLTPETKIEENLVCSERHRSFFKEQIGSSFSFNVHFQNWLKQNSGKTYQDAIQAYIHILEEKKKTPTKIDRQFEYNTYIRDFFEQNNDKSLKDAITCWKYKKSLAGHNKYEKKDLDIL
ncbi:DUF6434 domain-containing protein [Enterococcus larvae]|uniref:DUF6434 domain-containing protein n=1 Tax=Enterococcus larvae TaxID=2794352 RepID=UPI003F365482